MGADLPLGATRKRTVTINGRDTSFSCEDIVWTELRRLAAERRVPLATLIRGIARELPPNAHLSRALRCHVIADLRARAFPDGPPAIAPPPQKRRPRPAAGLAPYDPRVDRPPVPRP